MLLLQFVVKYTASLRLKNDFKNELIFIIHDWIVLLATAGWAARVKLFFGTTTME